MTTFPFTAVVGLDLAKKSLIYHAVDPRIGGTLFLGHRGCAKSTLVRAFAEVLRATRREGSPFVELPLGTTEDRLLGSVNAELLVEEGKWRGRRGLIEEANGGLLYIDEINLLPDHLSDLILDSAASGQYRLERDGLTRQVQARYILVGTMNPEEGDLRPQLSDRFAHGVEILDDFTTEQRMEIVQRRMFYDDEPDLFVDSFSEATQALIQKITRAQDGVRRVDVPDLLRRAVAGRARELQLEGVRAELAVIRTARCAAAWAGRSVVEEGDLSEAWLLCLGHRLPGAKSPLPGPQPRSFSSPPKNDQSSPSALNTKVAQEPHEATPDPLSLLPISPLADSGLSEWWSNSGRIRLVKPSGKGPLPKADSGQCGPIAWLETLGDSIREGWRPGKSGLRLQRSVRRDRRSLWCFLDASRSTGVNQFVSSARDALWSLARAAGSVRFHLLVLDANGTQWRLRKGSNRHFQAALSRVASAGGKSLLGPALKALRRSRERTGSSPGDGVLICSDGLASPAPGEKASGAWRSLRHAVRQISRDHTPIAWLHPAPKRGLSRWLDRICDFPLVTRFPL